MRRSRSRSRDADDEQDEEFLYGIRRSRDRTTYEHRETSALTPGQFMDQATYYSYSQSWLAIAFDIAEVTAGVASLFLHYVNLSRYQPGVDWVSQQITSLRNILKVVTFWIQWVMCHVELWYLRAEDLTVFARRPHRFKPHRWRHIEDISRDNSYRWFGLYRDDLSRLYSAWRIPNEMRAPRSAHLYDGEECFMIYLFHIMQGTAFTTMARDYFGGDPRRMSEMFETMVNHIYFTFYNKISGTSLDQWLPSHVDTCRHLIHRALSNGAIYETTTENGELINSRIIRHHFEFETFRIFGFIDDFAMRTARPGGNATRTHDLRQDIQRSFYSGYFKAHGLKAQVVYLPIGIIGSVFIDSIRENDNGMQNISGLNDYVMELLRHHLVGGLFPCLFGDGIFRLLATIVPRFRNPTPPLRLLNQRLCGLREVIEHVFAQHHIRFRLFDVPDRLRLWTHGVKIRRMSLGSFFVLNCHYCLSGTHSRFFGHSPPTLEEYLPLEEEIPPPPPVKLGTMWDYGGLRDPRGDVSFAAGEGDDDGLGGELA